MNNKDFLAHVGVLGMKWGVRKKREAEYRKKLSKAQKTAEKNINTSDSKYLKYRNSALGVRIAKTAASATVGRAIHLAMIGKLGSIKYMSKQQIAKEVGMLAATTAANVVLKDMLAKNVAKRYSDSGQHIKKTKGLLTPEERVETGIKVGTNLVIGAAILKSMSLMKVKDTGTVFESTGTKLISGGEYMDVLDKDGTKLSSFWK